MRCNWQTLARCAQQTLISPCFQASARPLSNKCLQSARTLVWSAARPHPRTFFTLSTPLASVKTHHQTPLLFPPALAVLPRQTPLISSSAQHLSPAKLSLILSKLVRRSVKTNDIDKAFLLVKLTTKPSLRPQLLADQPILTDLFLRVDSNAKISSRLVSHTLLHHLIRNGHIAEAYQTAKGMMTEGIHLRSTSLQGTIQALVEVENDNSVPTENHTVGRVGSVILSPGSATGPQSRAVIDLLNVASKTRNQRTRAMFDMLLSLCLLNGEIIVASLIFGFIAKNWKTKESFIAQTTEDFDSSPIGSEIGLKSSDINIPSKLQLFDIIREINRIITQDSGGRRSEYNFHKAFQALVNLAWLLDHRLIPHSDIAFLVQTIYACPEVDLDAWILNENNQPEKVHAYRYLHSVLSRLISNLPAKEPNPPYDVITSRVDDGWEGGIMPPLNLNSYNALVHYALRHQLSPALASQILDHMSTQREEPLKVDVSTINIILSSGKFMKRLDIVNQALSILKVNTISKWKDASTKDSFYLSEWSARADNVKRTLQESMRESLVSSALLPQNIPSNLKANSLSMAEYFSCLRTSGDPEAVAKCLFEILPGLRSSEIPQYTTLSPMERKRRRKFRLRVALRRASRLGPNVFTELLNCLLETGKFGLMQWVFNWARKAERWSWRDSTIKSWCLPTHAYTAMIEGCASIIKTQWGARLDEKECDLLKYELLPDTVSPKDGLGLCRTTLRMENKQKIAVARNSVQYIRHIMVQHAKTLYKLINSADARDDIRELIPPKPDARFYDALLSVHARCPGMRLRKAAAKRSRRKYMLRRSIRRGHKAAKTIATLNGLVLLEIVKEMLSAGFAIPMGLRHLFVSTLKPTTLTFEGNTAMNRTPHVFPDVMENSPRSPCSTPVATTKGFQ